MDESKNYAIRCENWLGFEKTGLTKEEVQRIIDAVVIAHCSKVSIGLACGVRAAVRGMAELGAQRSKREITFAKVKSNYCFGQSIQIACAIPAIKGDLEFEAYMQPDGEVTLYGKGKAVTIRMKGRSFQGAQEVFDADDAEVFEEVLVK